MLTVLKHKFLWIAALGYFVDLFDLVLYGVVRVASLRDLGVPEAEMFTVGARLLNYQMGGMLVGGFVWGMIGDRKGRKQALFGSIFLYSLATFLNAFVPSVEVYAALRFFAGFGLAGELGAAITLTSETLPQDRRGLGAAFIATIGFMGAALSSFITQLISWQSAYLVGGILGFMLLFARMGIQESFLFSQTQSKEKRTQWGSLKLMFASQKRSLYFVLAFLSGVPIWYVAGILSYFAPEFARDFNIIGPVTAGNTIMVGYIGAMLGDIACGLLSQRLRSRKKAVMIFMATGATLAISSAFFLHGQSNTLFYATRLIIGFGNGFFAMLIAWIAEIYGTNLRATAATVISNLIRGSVIPLAFLFQWLRPSMGFVQASVWIGGICFGTALICVSFLPETFDHPLNFTEI